MDEKRLVIRRIMCTGVMLLTIVVFMGVLVKFQIVDGEQYAATVNTASQRTVAIKAARGEIVDRNGKPIVVNRQGYSIVFDYSFFPSGNVERNSIILSLIKLFEENDVAWTNDLPLVLNSSGAVVYRADSQSEIEVMKSKDYLDLNAYATAQNCFDELSKRYELSEYPAADALKIAAVRYQMALNAFGSGNPYTFAEDVSDVMVAKVKENSAVFKGVDVEIVPYREYVDGTLAPHIIGYVDKINAEEYALLKDKGYGMNDLIGKSGIEYSMEDYLRGIDGEKVITTDIDGNVTVEVTEEPVQGRTIVLTLDIEMQRIAQEVFEQQAESYAASSQNKNGIPAAGAVIVNDPNTGEILASVSYPSYDLATYKENAADLITNKDGRSRLWNRALRSTYAIGSTSKPSVAIAALEEGITNRDRVISCNGRYPYLDQTYVCQVIHSTRNETVRTALQDSCNTYFFTCGEALGVERLNEYRSMLGLGVKSGVELTEAEGVLDSPEYRESIGQTWLPGYLIQSSIGQAGNLFTPVQMLNYAATIANGGTRYEQHFIKSIKSADYSETIVEKNAKVVLETGLSEYSVNCVKEGMEYVVNNSGSRTYLSGMSVQAAAKTGTAEETRKINGAYVDIDNGFYITFAPSDRPEIAMAIVCEGIYGSSYLASIARPIYDYYFENSKTADAPQSENSLLG